ncbi:hypothetical protein DA2_1717 [Desulfovibrio sp. A2]|nr:hypothetical protein DA2_1717 [Desulfovibrio sp. A2]
MHDTPAGAIPPGCLHLTSVRTRQADASTNQYLSRSDSKSCVGRPTVAKPCSIWKSKIARFVCTPYTPSTAPE